MVSLKNAGVAVGAALTGYVILFFLAPDSALVFAGGLLLGGLINQPLSKAKRLPTVGDTGEMTTLFIGNVAYKAGEPEIRSLFSKYGEVLAVRLVIDKRSGRPRGYGFVEMAASGAEKAIKELNDTDFAGRMLKVNVANERKPRS
ncbi:MAG: RNA-binding protein [Gammaproteobacteria bacterium]|nr:MAG: RNA-binding protein [Gammaproteobacteria bacterium]